MKLKKMVLRNFRNYLNETSFDLSKNITILYGDNGNGKSSFFDAIEWCITDDVSRFNNNIEEKKDVLSNSNMNLNDECSVAIYFGDYILKRSFKKINKDYYSNMQIVLINTVDNTRVIGKVRVEKKLKEIVQKNSEEYWSSELLSQAYILSQSQITNFITKDTRKDRYKSLASIMGFEKINTLRSNLIKTSDVVQVKINQIKENRTLLETRKLEQLKHLEEQMDKSKLTEIDIKEKFDIRDNSEKLNQIKTKKSIIDNQLSEINKVYIYKKNNLSAYEKAINDKENTIINVEKDISEKTDYRKNLLKEVDVAEQILIQINKDKEQEKKQKSKIENLNNLLNRLEENKYKYDDDLLNKILMNLETNKSKISKMKYAVENVEMFKNKKIQNDLIEKKISQLKGESIKNQEKLIEVANEKNNLITEFSEGEVLKNIQNILNLVENANEISKENKKFENNCPVCDSEVKNVSRHFDRKIEKLINESGTHKELIQNNVKRREKLEGLNKDILRQEKELSSKMKNYEKNILDNSNYLARLENNSLFEILYFEKKCIELQSILDNLIKEEKYLIENVGIIKEINELKIDMKLSKNMLRSNNNFSIEEVTTNKEKNISQISVIEKNLRTYKEIIDKEKKDMNDLIISKKIIDSIAKKYNIDNYDKLIDYLSKEKLEIAEQEKKIVSSFEKSEQINVLNSLKGNIEILKNEELDNDSLSKYFEDKFVGISEKIELLNNRFGNKTSEFLNNDNSTITKYYRYLNPNPTEFDELYFEISNTDELDIEVKNQSNCLNANYILSSGQLNVLAISVFIATNMAQNFSLFDFIAIDDPIQNMDDVNRFSITDVLSEINRQLIFSTHDFDYLNLFLKKNDYRLDDIAVYHLNSEKNEYKNLLIS
ncbi:AAA family ATPase [Brochothrix thermosphacta]|uniref:AAA family ATPase n=1 Tax=Brochothrix thermosphacta TaxID=2756 RepID=UPI00083F5513|nr:SMC family ATPase [Brochothrix thermosphacta]ODJ57128.1 hypothetical protein BFR41_00895 [Brochothrix thermosphacta]ODJ72537.1 hypothetical protein BFR43_02335 [Brochothrix thermosphacta]